MPDSADNCLLVPNADQSDLDSDGIGDACDPTPGSTPGRVSGGGWIGAKSPFTAQYASGVTGPSGDVVYEARSDGVRFRSSTITSLIDLGEPGVGDTFRISWDGYAAGGVLNGGNIQIFG